MFGFVGRLRIGWLREKYHQSRRCSSVTYPESNITKCSSKRRSLSLSLWGRKTRPCFVPLSTSIRRDKRAYTSIRRNKRAYASTRRNKRASLGVGGGGVTQSNQHSQIDPFLVSRYGDCIKTGTPREAGRIKSVPNSGLWGDI